MTESVTDPATIQDIKFSFLYTTFSLVCGAVLVLVTVLSEGVTASGRVLHSPQLLALAGVYELGKVWVVRTLSGHGSSLSLKLPTSLGQGDSRPVRGPLLRKVWIKLSRLLAKLRPLWQVSKGLVILTCCWLFLVYITVCFGAPIMSAWWETGTFCLLLLLLTVFPCLLVEGPSLDTLHTVLTVQSGLERSDCSTSLHTLHTLHHNVLYTCVGAWLGAVPIPLDWDRDWQSWPISCCLGAALGHLLANLVATVRIWPRLASINTHSKRKIT